MTIYPVTKVNDCKHAILSRLDIGNELTVWCCDVCAHMFQTVDLTQRIVKAVKEEPFK